MANQNSSLRFDHREIAVIFSLFIFVSLLMFTVGILVGKGLAQAKYEGNLFGENAGAHRQIASAPLSQAQPEPEAEPVVVPAPTEEAPATAAAITPPPIEEPTPVVETPPTPPLQLIPKRNRAEFAGSTLQEPTRNKDAEALLKNPKIRSLLEGSGPNPAAAPAAAKRQPASVPPTAAAAPAPFPKSFAQGKFTVQVGSYPTERDATDRVEALKKLGFPYAYFSAKELLDKKETWYRVWLGNYPDASTAEASGKILQDRGEVKSYVVRKTDTTS